MTTISLHDAYTQWLGIASAELPPHHYRLLGISLCEPNPQAILSAYNERTAQVAAHLNGPHVDTARRMFGELAAAQACLLDPQAKSAYDEWLRQQAGDHAQATGNHTATSSSATLKRPAPRSSADMNAAATTVVATGATVVANQASALDVAPPQPPSSAAAAQPQSVHHHEPQAPTSALPWLIGGACVGLLGVCVLGLILLGVSHGRQSVAAGDNTNVASAASHRAADQGKDDSSRQRDRRPVLPSDDEQCSHGASRSRSRRVLRRIFSSRSSNYAFSSMYSNWAR